MEGIEIPLSATCQMPVIETLVEIFAAAMKAVLAANNDAEAEEEALIAAEAQLAAVRARRKFGQS